MAEITHRPFVSHVRTTPTSYLVHLRRGRPRHSGAGLAFWFRPLTSALAEVPLDDHELPVLFHARTADAQDVAVQATVGYRVADPAVAAARLDFSVDLRTGTWTGAPLDHVALLLTELAQQYARELLVRLPVTEAIGTAVPSLRAAMTDGLTGDARLADVGIVPVGVRVVAVSPERDLERALQTPTREALQQDADRATYERRATAVERERAISENELQSRIELAVREERLVTQQGANERRRAEEAAAARRVEVEAEAATARTRAAAQADNDRLLGAAEAEATAARMAAYSDVAPEVLLALAAKDLAGSLPSIGTLNLAPDVLTAALAAVTGRATA